MIRYIDRTDFEDYSLEISFLGMEEKEKNSSTFSDVEIRLLKKSYDFIHNSPFKELWLSLYKDINVPKGVWHGIKLGQILNEYVIVAIGNSIIKLNLTTGTVLWKREFGNNSIHSIKLTEDKKELYVLYSYYEFESVNNNSNFIKIDLNGNLVWSLKLQIKNDSVTEFRFRENSLFVNTWNCFSLKIDERNGEILESKFTK